MEFNHSDKNDKQLQDYLYNLGATAALENEPCNDLEKQYMYGRGVPIKGKDSFNAYIEMMSYLGDTAIKYSTCPDMFLEEYREIVFPDLTFDRDELDEKGILSQVSYFKFADQYQTALDLIDKLPIHISGFKADSHEDYVDQVRQEFIDDKQDLIHIVETYIGKPIDTPSTHSSELIIDVNVIGIDVAIKQYEEAINNKKQNEFYSIDMNVPISAEIEVEYEAMDVLALAHHMKYSIILLPDHQTDLCRILNNSGQQAYFVSDDQWGSLKRSNLDVLYWGATFSESLWNSVIRERLVSACYVRIDQLKDYDSYYPSLLYGRGYAIDLVDIRKEKIFQGFKPARIKARGIVMMNLFFNSWYYRLPYYHRDIYASYFCIPVVRGRMSTRTYSNIRFNDVFPTYAVIIKIMEQALKHWGLMDLTVALAHRKQHLAVWLHFLSDKDVCILMLQLIHRHGKPLVLI